MCLRSHKSALFSLYSDFAWLSQAKTTLVGVLGEPKMWTPFTNAAFQYDNALPLIKIYIKFHYNLFLKNIDNYIPKFIGESTKKTTRLWHTFSIFTHFFLYSSFYQLITNKKSDNWNTRKSRKTWLNSNLCTIAKKSWFSWFSWI